jgi:hypothetical protein
MKKQNKIFGHIEFPLVCIYCLIILEPKVLFFFQSLLFKQARVEQYDHVWLDLGIFLALIAILIS